MAILDFALFPHLSVADNVAFGLERTEPMAVRRASERAQLAKDVGELPHGYDTVVGERGVMLSGGQRQRTALARALALDPRILILDDTLSAVDAETEAAIKRELEAVFRGRTVVVVSCGRPVPGQVVSSHSCPLLALVVREQMADSKSREGEQRRIVEKE